MPTPRRCVAYTALALALACQAAPPSPAKEPSTTPAPSPASVPAPASAPRLREQIDALALPLVEDEWAVGLIIGVVTPDGTQVFSYGRRSATDPRPPAEDSLFEIGSLTKVFTGILLAEQERRGEVSRLDPVSKYLPAGVPAPRRGADEITLLDLATHSSGLPSVADNFWPPGGGSIYDPNVAGRGWSEYTEEKLFAYLRDPRPPLGSTRRYLYSNLGMGLLGALLGRAAGRPYEELLIERVITPLGLSDTRFVLSEEQRARLLPGHDADGTPTQAWTPSALSGAFALRSSMRDMLRFTQANLGLVESPLAKALMAAQQEYFRQSKDERIGLAWTRNGFGVVYHFGATGGYRSTLFLHPSKQLGVVVLSNSLVGGTTDERGQLFDALGGSVMNLLVGVPPPVWSYPSPIELPEARLADYEGNYGPVRGATEPLRVTRERGALWALLPGRVPNRLYPAEEDKFFMKAYNARVSFSRDETGAVTALTLGLGELTRFLPRLPPAP